jgi:hypothetical protein
MPVRKHLWRRGDDGLRNGEQSKNIPLAIQRQQRRSFRIKFLKLHDASLSQRRQDANQRRINRRLRGFAQADRKWWPYASSGGSPQMVADCKVCVADLFHPVNCFAIELFLNGDVRHGRGRRGTVPMLFTRRELDHVTRPDLLDRPARALSETAAGRHDQSLAQRMRMPGRPRARLKRDTGADRTCRWV